MPPSKKDRKKGGPRSFRREAPPTITGPRRRALLLKIAEQKRKEKEAEVVRLQKKEEMEKKLHEEAKRDEMDLETVAKLAEEKRADPAERLKVLEDHLEELTQGKHKLFMLLKHVLAEDEKKKQEQEAEKKRQQKLLEQQQQEEEAMALKGKESPGPLYLRPPPPPPPPNIPPPPPPKEFYMQRAQGKHGQPLPSHSTGGSSNPNMPPYGYSMGMGRGYMQSHMMSPGYVSMSPVVPMPPHMSMMGTPPPYNVPHMSHSHPQMRGIPPPAPPIPDSRRGTPTHGSQQRYPPR